MCKKILLVCMMFFGLFHQGLMGYSFLPLNKGEYRQGQGVYVFAGVGTTGLTIFSGSLTALCIRDAMKLKKNIKAYEEQLKQTGVSEQDLKKLKRLKEAYKLSIVKSICLTGTTTVCLALAAFCWFLLHWYNSNTYISHDVREILYKVKDKFIALKEAAGNSKVGTDNEIRKELGGMRRGFLDKGCLNTYGYNPCGRWAKDAMDGLIQDLDKLGAKSNGEATYDTIELQEGKFLGTKKLDFDDGRDLNTENKIILYSRLNELLHSSE